MTRKAKWGLAGGLAALCATLIGVVHTPWAQRRALGILGDYLRAEQGIELRAGEFGYNLFDLSVTLADVRLSAVKAPELPPLLELRRAEAKLRWSGLLRGKVVVDRMVVDGAAVRIVRDERGRDNLPEGKAKVPAADPNAPLGFVIANASLSGGSFRYEDRGVAAVVELPQWGAEVEGDVEGGPHVLRLETGGGGTVLAGGERMAVRQLAVALRLAAGRVDVSRIQLETEGAGFEVSGSLRDFAKPVVRAQVRARVDLKQAGRMAGLSEPLGGRAVVSAEVEGPLAGLRVVAHVEGDGLALRGYNGIGLRAAGKWDAATQKIQVDALEAKSSVGRIGARGAIGLGDAGRSELQGSIGRLDLAAISRAEGLPVNFSGMGEAEWRAAWRGMDWEAMQGGAKIRVGPVGQAAKDVVPLEAAVAVEARDGRIRLDVTKLEALGIGVAGDMSLGQRRRLGGRLQAVVGDVSQAVRQIELVLGRGEGTLVGMKVGGRMELTSELSGELEKPVLTAELRGEGLQAGGIKDALVTARVEVGGGEARLDQMSVQWKGQEVTVRGAVGLEKGDAPVRAEIRMAGVSVGAVLDGLGQKLPVEARVGLQATVGGTLGRLQGEAVVQADGVKAYGEDWGRLRVAARLDGQQAVLRDLVLEKPNEDGPAGRLTARGEFNLAKGTYQILVGTEGLNLRGLVPMEGVTVRGKADLSVRGEGTIHDPSLRAGLNVEVVEAGELRSAVELQAEVVGRTAVVKGRLPEWNIALDGRAGIDAPYVGDFQLTAEDTDLGRLGMKAGEKEKLGGRLSAKISGAGELSDWRKLAVETVVTRVRLEAMGQQLDNEGPLEFGVRGGMLRVASAKLRMSGSTLAMSGELPLGPGGTAGQGLQVKGAFELADLMRALPPEQGFAARGQIRLEGEVGGNVERLDPSLRVWIEGGAVERAELRQTVTGIEVDAGYSRGVVELRKLAASLGAGRLAASGKVPLGKFLANLPLESAPDPGEAHFSLSATGFEPQSLVAAPEQVSGEIGVKLEVEVPDLTDWKSVRARAVFDQLRVKLAEYGQYELKQEGESALALRDGSVTVEKLLLIGPKTRIEAGGRAGLFDGGELDFRIKGSVDAGLAGLLAEGVRLTGESRFEVSVAGKAEQPRVSGFLEMEQGQVSVPALQLAAERLNFRLGLAPERVTIERFTGSLNGGELEAGGHVAFSGADWKEIRLRAAWKDAFFNLPDGLKTRVRGEIALGSKDRTVELSGNVTIMEGSYREPLTLEGGLLASLKGGKGIELTQERSEFLASVRYNVGVSTAGPVVIDNNLGKVAASADLKLVGTYYRPSVVGRVTLEEGGELYLNERTYLVERGMVTLVNEARIEPVLDVLAKTKASGYEIDLKLSGGAEDFTSTFSSEPPLSQPDIISVLVTGRTLEDVQGAEVDVAKSQALSYLAGGASAQVSRAAQQTLGLSRVRIEPNLISPESNPGARLTVGQDITNYLSLIYSMNLIDSGDQIYIAEWDITKRFEARAIRQQDNTYRMEFRHDLRFGGEAVKSVTAARGQQRIGNISIAGNETNTKEELAGKAGLKEGAKYDFFKVQKGMDRLERFYDKQGRLEARVRLEREVAESVVDLRLNVVPGPAVEFAYEGYALPGGVQKKVRRIWSEGLFDAQRKDEATRAIRAQLVERGYLEAAISCRATGPPGAVKRVTFSIAPGTRYRDVDMVFEGAAGVSASELMDVIQRQKLTLEVHLNPRKATGFLKQYCVEQGYLAAEVAAPVYDLVPETQTAKVIIQVAEGPLFRVGKLSVAGNAALGEAQLRKDLPLETGRAYRPELLQKALAGLEEEYWRQGYSDVDVRYALEAHKEEGVVDVAFRITENRKTVVESVQVEGNRQTSDRFVLSQMGVEAGEALDFEKTAKSRRDLYDTGAYSLVDIQAQPGIAAASEPDALIKPVAVNVKVREVRPFELRYGAYYDSGRGPGFIADFANRNTLGSARVIGGRVRWDSDIRELRGYFSQPLLRSLPMKTNVVGYTRREFFDTFITDRIGVSVQEEMRFRKSMILSFGYRLERADTYDKDPDSIFKVPPYNLAPLTFSFTRDTADELLDATRGSLLSQAVEYAPQGLGSDLKYVRYYGQYFKYVPLARATEIPWRGGKKKVRLVYAGGVRVGLGSGLGGQDLIRSERFFSGGGTTVRGYEQNSLGPVDFLGDPSGGDAVFITNQELRFPVWHILDAVAFVDAGNVYGKVAEFRPWDLRASAGAGLRVRTPYFLLRFDYGLKLNRRTGQSRGGFFFNIGQAF